MYTKSLVSIYFLKEKALIVEMAGHGKSVRKYATVELPAELIKDHKVQNVSSLAGILKEAWQKNGIREKSVSIVIPEFLTFTKLVKLPNLTLGELGEAINWQAKEYLPDGGGQMILDWKTVEKTDKGIEALLVAVPREILMGYVDACETAELFPLGVQTPSLSLTNLISQQDEGVLIIYVGFLGETIITTSLKEKIFGTSVIADYQNFEEIVGTAKKMISHFNTLDIKKIYLGGLINENVLTGIKKLLGKEVFLLSAPVSGIPKDKMQEYLIPISMQLKELAEPDDPKTLNLLPANLVSKYKVAKAKIQVWSLTLTITLFVWVSFLIVLGSFLLISQQIAVIKTANSGKSHIESARLTYQQEATAINNTSDKILKIKKSYVAPETILNIVSAAKPPGVRVLTYKMDFEKGNIALSGISQNRQALITFRQNLEGSANVSAVNIPISSFEQEIDLEFSMTFHYGEVSQNLPAGNPPRRINEPAPEL